MDYYTVTAVSAERNVTCHATSEPLTYYCSILAESDVNDYNFTAYPVTRGFDDGYLYRGSITRDCCKAIMVSPENTVPFPRTGLLFPEHVTADEEECGLVQRVNISWQVSTLGRSLYHCMQYT